MKVRVYVNGQLKEVDVQTSKDATDDEIANEFIKAINNDPQMKGLVNATKLNKKVKKLKLKL